VFQTQLFQPAASLESINIAGIANVQALQKHSYNNHNADDNGNDSLDVVGSKGKVPKGCFNPMSVPSKSGRTSWQLDIGRHSILV